MYDLNQQKVSTTRKINNKPLTSDIILTPQDIGAEQKGAGGWYPGDIKMCAAGLDENELELGWKFANGVGTYKRAGRTFAVPNLLDRFIIAGGSAGYPVGKYGGSFQATTKVAGKFQPTVTVQNKTPTIATTASHNHVYLKGLGHHQKGGSTWPAEQSAVSENRNSTSVGGSQPHNHAATCSTVPDHQHTVTVVQPYYALALLCFIGVKND